MTFYISMVLQRSVWNTDPSMWYSKIMKLEHIYGSSHQDCTFSLCYEEMESFIMQQSCFLNLPQTFRKVRCLNITLIFIWFQKRFVRAVLKTEMKNHYWAGNQNLIVPVWYITFLSLFFKLLSILRHIFIHLKIIEDELSFHLCKGFSIIVPGPTPQ